MKAFTLDAFGSAPQLRHDLGQPRPNGGEVLVRVLASSVNPVDAAIAAGMLREVAEHRFPVILGRDYAGVVEQVGSGVTAFGAGDPVYGFLPYADPAVQRGTWCELIAVAQDGPIAPQPARLDTAAAGAVPLAGVTALACLDALHLGDGDTLLVIGASGGVGSLAVALAARAGVPVLATGRGDDVDYLRDLGAEEVVDRDGDITEEVRPHHEVTALIDLVSGTPEALQANAAVLSDGGRAVSPLGAAGDIPGEHNVMGVASAANLRRLAQLIDERSVPVPIDRTYALADAGVALEAVTGEHKRGKLALSLD